MFFFNLILCNMGHCYVVLCACYTLKKYNLALNWKTAEVWQFCSGNYLCNEHKMSLETLDNLTSMFDQPVDRIK